MFLRYLFLVSVLFILAGCSKQEQKSAPAPGGGAAPMEYADLSAIPGELRTAFESFGKQLEKGLRSMETNAVRADFDRAAIADALCEGLQGAQSEFKAGVMEGLARSVGQMVQQWSGKECKYKGLVLYKGSAAARFRFAGESGIALVDFVLRRNSPGKVRIINFCNHAMGYDLVEQGRQAAAPMLAELDKGFLKRLVNKPNISSADITRFGDMAKKFARKDFAGVVRDYKALPPTLRETMAATGMQILALQNLGDDDKYKQALKEAAVRFNSASFQFMLVDAYYLEKDYDNAIRCIDNFMKALEKDAALLALKSLMLNAKGDVSGARTLLREAFSMEPDCTYVHSKGLDVLMAAKDYAGVRDSMIFLEENAGYDFKGGM